MTGTFVSTASRDSSRSKPGKAAEHPSARQPGHPAHRVRRGTGRTWARDRDRDAILDQWHAGAGAGAGPASAGGAQLPAGDQAGARDAAFVNGLPPAPELIGISSAAIITGYTLRFTARDKNGPAVVVSTGECGTDVITVDGKPQPRLWDTHDRLAVMARELLGSGNAPR